MGWSEHTKFLVTKEMAYSERPEGREGWTTLCVGCLSTEILSAIIVCSNPWNIKMVIKIFVFLYCLCLYSFIYYSILSLFFRYVCVYLSLSLCHSVYVCLSFSPSLSFFFLPVSLFFLSHSLILCVIVSNCISVSVTVCECVHVLSIYTIILK